MTVVAELLTVVLSCPQWLDKTINFSEGSYVCEHVFYEGSPEIMYSNLCAQ